MGLTEREAEQTRARVKKYYANNDRLSIVLPQGTNERIRACGFVPYSFGKEVILAELEKQERMLGIRVTAHTDNKT